MHPVYLSYCTDAIACVKLMVIAIDHVPRSQTLPMFRDGSFIYDWTYQLVMCNPMSNLQVVQLQLLPRYATFMFCTYIYNVLVV